ncbi:MAG: Stp1/IreP family PP2C-type Ser/Thr phosphatase [Chloroflexota bacterium]
MRTDQGRVRDHNEDFVAFHLPSGPEEESQNGQLYIVADGVGGSDAGEVASRYATERTIHHFLANSAMDDWGERLRQAMLTANTELRKLSGSQYQGLRMATTMVATVLHDDQATLANVGDSRAYHWRTGVIRQITKDQSLVARLLEEGAITEQEAANHPRKNVILHSLGSESAPEIDLYEVDLLPGEMLVLCSDGLTRHVSDAEIANAVGAMPTAEATETLIQLANSRGGEDNISVAVLSIGEQPAASLPDSISAPRMVSGVKTLPDGAHARRAMWIYTAILCAVQVLLIVLIWNLVNS